MAEASNQIWCWEITKLLGPTKWMYFYLYVVPEIFSRYAVGCMIAERENSALDAATVLPVEHCQCFAAGQEVVLHL